MASYVDGFVLPIPRKNAALHRRIAKQVGEIFRDHGAHQYAECAANDVKPGLQVARASRSRAPRAFGRRMIYGGFEAAVEA